MVATALLIMAAATRGLACGDKFQRIGRGARYQRGYAAVHPACILVYARPGSASAGIFRELEPTLKRAGHKLAFVDATGDLTPALRTGHYNLVLTDYDDAAQVEKQARAVGPGTPIVPLLRRPSPEVRAAAARAYPCLVESPGRRTDVLERIDDLMESLGKVEAGAKK